MKDGAAAYPRYHVKEFTRGLERTRQFTVRLEDIAAFTRVSCDDHPLHTDHDLATLRGYPAIVAHGMLVAARCSGFFARDFIGSHGLLVHMACDFRQPVFGGDLLTWQAHVANVVIEAGTVEIGWSVTNQKGAVVQRGTACAWLPGS